MPVTRAMPIAAVLAAMALAPIAGASGEVERKPKSPTVKVADDFFDPTKLTVKEGTTVRFKWASDNTNSHNVVLEKGPKGVKKKDFESATGTIRIKFNPTFEKKGAYDLLCTIHPDVMKMKVTVKG